MDILANLAGGGGIVGAITGAVGGIASAFVKYKTLKEEHKHTFDMAELAGRQEIQRAAAELKLRKMEGDIQTDLAIEQSLQESFKHDAALGDWLKSKDVGAFGNVVLAVAEFVRMMMRPALTLTACIYVFRMYDAQFAVATEAGMAADTIAGQLQLIASTIVLLATVSFTWWFADRSVAKSLNKRLNG